MALSKEQFENTRIGTQVAAVYGPSDFPTYDLCAEVGTIADKGEDRWGRYFEVVMHGGHIERMTSIATHNSVGFHLLKS